MADHDDIPLDRETINANRRALFRGLPYAAMAVVAPMSLSHAMTVTERVEHHIAELRKALAELDRGPLELRLQSDQGAVIDTVAGRAVNKGVPRTLWRVEA